MFFFFLPSPSRLVFKHFTPPRATTCIICAHTLFNTHSSWTGCLFFLSRHSQRHSTLKKKKSAFRVHTVMENLEKSWNFKMVISRSGKVMEKNLNHKSFEKVMGICHNHMFIYAKFDIMNMFFKERRLKCKPAYALNTQDFLKCSCLYRDFSLVMEIWFKVMQKSWKSIGQHV